MLTFLSVELAARRGLRTWPKGASWPAEVHPSHVHADDAHEETTEEDDSDEEARAASRKLAETQESALAEQTHRRSSTEERSIPDRELSLDLHTAIGRRLLLERPENNELPRQSPLRSCEVWIGSSDSNETDSSRLDDLDEDALMKRDGIGIVYIPLAPNEARVPGFDAFVVSTWRREVTAEESQAILDVAEVSIPGPISCVPLINGSIG